MNDYLHVLDQDETPLGILSNELPEACPYYDDRHTERLEHGLLTLDFNIPANDPMAENVMEEGYIVYPIEDGEMQLFQIKEIKDIRVGVELRKQIFAENAAVSDLLGEIIRPATLNSYTLEQVMSYILQGTGWELGIVEYAGVRDFKFEDYPTSLAALHEVMDAFGAEVKFRVVFDRYTVQKRYIDVLTRRGEDTRVTFTYEHDIHDEIERTVDTKDLATALIGVGKSDTNGKPLTFAGYTPPEDPKYEKVDDWVGHKEAFQRWGKRGKHIFSVYRDDSATTDVELYNNTLKRLDEVSKPRYTYKVKVSLLEKDARLGDTIVVKDISFKPELVLEARVIEKVTSKKDPTTDNVTLGEFRPIFAMAIPDLDRIQDIIRQNEDRWNRGGDAAGTGTHVIANGPKPLIEGGYAANDAYLTIEVTENVHLGHVSVFSEFAGNSGTVELRDSNGTVLEKREFTDMVQGENRLHLNFLLLESVGSYQLYGAFDDTTFRTTEGLKFPYDSGTFKITGTSSFGFWYHFYNISIGGSGVTGGLGHKMTVGDNQNFLGTVQALDQKGEATFLMDKDQLTLSKATVGEVVSPSVVNVSTDLYLEYWVDPVTGDDENDGSFDYRLKSVTEALSRIPRVFDGEIYIYISDNVLEDIDIMGYLGSGKLILDFNLYTYTGSITIRSVKARVDILNGTLNYRQGETSSVISAYQSDYVFIDNCVLRGNPAAAGTGTGSVVSSYDGSFIYILDSEVYNANHSLLKAAYGGKMAVKNVAGQGAERGLYAEYAGSIGIAGYIPDCQTDYQGVLGGQIIYSGTPSVQAGTAQSAPTPPNRSTWVTKVGTGSFRTPNNKWREDGLPRQGQWDYSGHHTGVWLFEAALSTTLTGKTIKRMWIDLTRLNEGGNGETTVTIRWHGYTLESPPPTNSKPVVSTDSFQATFKRGEYRRIVLPDNFLTQFQSGAAKGIAIYTDDTTNDSYAVFSEVAYIYADYV